MTIEYISRQALFQLEDGLTGRRGAGTAPSGISDPDAALEYYAAQDEARYNQYIQPAVDNLASQIDGTDLIDAAKERNATAYQDAETNAKRQLSRYGLEMTPAQLAAFRRRKSMEAALGKVQNLSRARQGQFEKSANIAGTLANAGQGLSSLGSNSMLSAMQTGSQRDLANKQAKQAFDQQMIQTGLSIGGSIAGLWALGLI